MILFEVTAFDRESRCNHVWIVAARDEAEACRLVPAPERPVRTSRLGPAASRWRCVIGRLGAISPPLRAIQSMPAISSSRSRSRTNTWSALSSRITSSLRSLVKVRLTVSMVSPR